MPYIFVRHSPNEHHFRNSKRVAKEAYRGTETYIDSNVQYILPSLPFLRTYPVQSRFFSNGSLRLSTPCPPCEVLHELAKLGFSVIAANTDHGGETTMWTLQSVKPRIIVRTIMDKNKNQKTYIKSSFRWIPAGMNILQSRLGPLKNPSSDANKRDSLFSTQCLPWKVLHELKALGFSVVLQCVGVTTGEWTLEGVSHHIFVRNKMNTETVPIPNDDVQQSRQEAKEAYRNTTTYINSSFQWTPALTAYLEHGLGPLTRYNVDKDGRVNFLSSPRSPDVVMSKLGALGFSVVAQNTVGVTNVWTLRL